MTRKTTPYGRRLARLREAGQTRAMDGMRMLKMHNTRLTPAELARILTPCREALAAMRQGGATFEHYVTLCTAGHVAEAIEDGGIYRGQRDIIEQANRALDAISARLGNTAEAWTPGPLYGPEISAIADLIAAHSRQVHELTYGEYKRAADKAVARAATDGAQVFSLETTAP